MPVADCRHCNNVSTDLRARSYITEWLTEKTRERISPVVLAVITPDSDSIWVDTTQNREAVTIRVVCNTNILICSQLLTDMKLLHSFLEIYWRNQVSQTGNWSAGPISSTSITCALILAYSMIRRTKGFYSTPIPRHSHSYICVNSYFFTNLFIKRSK